jgi:DNA repair protein RadA/Sms
MVLAVLEAHGGVRLGQHDVYLSVAGGLNIDEPAADLAAAAALVSSLSGAPLPIDCVFFGELGLSGSARPVIHTGLRLKEAAKLGFRRAVAPPPPGERNDETPPDMQVGACAHISALVARIAALGQSQPQALGQSQPQGDDDSAKSPRRVGARGR